MNLISDELGSSYHWSLYYNGFSLHRGLGLIWDGRQRQYTRDKDTKISDASVPLFSFLHKSLIILVWTSSRGSIKTWHIISVQDILFTFVIYIFTIQDYVHLHQMRGLPLIVKFRPIGFRNLYLLVICRLLIFIFNSYLIGDPRATL